jgi:hypothetical protein
MNNKTPLVDKYLQSLDGMQEARTSPFFYAQVKNKMENRYNKERVIWRPAFAIGILLIFLFINFWMLKQQRNDNSTTALQSFAQAYDFSTISY